MVSILTINYGVIGEVSIDVNARRPTTVYTAFTQLKLTKSMVSILTSPKLRYHELCCGGSYAYHLYRKCYGGKYNYHVFKIHFMVDLR
jgi:hypothetical protein